MVLILLLFRKKHRAVLAAEKMTSIVKMEFIPLPLRADSSSSSSRWSSYYAPEERGHSRQTDEEVEEKFPFFLFSPDLARRRLDHRQSQSFEATDDLEI